MKKAIVFTALLLSVLTAALFFTSCTRDENIPEITPQTEDGINESTVESDAAKKGVLSSFSATTFAGETVSAQIFAQKKLTMVNIWATFCSPCIREMPDLGELNKKYADQGFQIIGIPVDVVNRDGTLADSKVATAKEIIEKTNADYTHILPSDSLIKAKLGAVNSVPETIFVDKNGAQVGKSYIGSRSEAQWAAIIEELLKQIG